MQTKIWPSSIIIKYIVTLLQTWWWCGRGSCYGNRLSLGYLSNSRSKKGEVSSRTFWPRSFFSVVAEDLRGPNVLLLTSPFCYVNCLDTPEKDLLMLWNLVILPQTLNNKLICTIVLKDFGPLRKWATRFSMYDLKIADEKGIVQLPLKIPLKITWVARNGHSYLYLGLH